MNSTMLSQIGERLGWTLLHSLWQFTVVALLLLMFLRLLCRGSAQARYLAGCASLAMMAAAVPLTFATIEPTARIQLGEVNEPEVAATQEIAKTDLKLSVVAGAAGPEQIPLEFDVAGSSKLDIDANFNGDLVDPVSLAQESAGIESLNSTMALEWKPTMRRLVDRCVVHLPIAWLMGVLVLSLRPAVGWFYARRLRRIGTCTVALHIRDMAEQVALRIGIRKAVSVVESTLVDVPTVIGELRPLVLLPASAITGLSREQLEAVIAHELAHVRRHDYLVNWLQTIAETVFFYHPALWWVSRQMRNDREDCCDDIAMGITGDRAGYANMLVTLDSLREDACTTHLPAVHVMSSGGGSLVSRIRRIIRKPAPTPGAGSLVVFGLLLLAFTITITSSMLPSGSNLRAQDPIEAQQPQPSQETAAETSDTGRVPLEMRILANPPNATRKPRVSSEQLIRYRQQLEAGELNVDDHNDKFRWIAIADDPGVEQEPSADETLKADEESNFPVQGLHQRRRYALACNGREHVIAWPDINQHVKRAELLPGDGDAPQLEIEFDHALRKIVIQVTSNNLENRLAIIVEGRIVSAPRIQSIVHRSARITGRFTNEQARRLQSALAGAIASDDDSHPLCLQSNASPASTDDPLAAEESEPWFRPRPHAQPHDDLRNGKGYWFVEIAADPEAQADLQLTDRQRRASDDIQRLFHRGGPDAVVAKTSMQRQQLWMQARKAVEALLTDSQVKRLEQLIIQRAGEDAFRDPVIIMALEMTDEQREKVNGAFDTYRHLLVANQTQFEQVEILSLTGNSSPPAGRLTTIHQLKLRRDQVALRQLWANIRQILTSDQRRIFNQLRGPMPAAMQKELSKLDEFVSPVSRFDSSVTVLEPMHSDAIPVALDVPDDLEIIEAWRTLRRQNGQPPPSATELLNFRRVIEKTTDYADPPRFYPLIGMARLHHATYVCSIYTTDNRLEVVYIDHSHFHPLATVDTYHGPSSLRRSIVQVAFETPIVNPPNQRTLMRFRIRNHSEQPLRKVDVFIDLPDSLHLQEATSGGTVDGNRITWEFETIESGREQTLEIQANVDTGSVGPLTVLVQVDGKNTSYGQFSLPKPEARKPKPKAAEDPFSQ